MTRQEALERVEAAAKDFWFAVQMGDATAAELEELEREAGRAARQARAAGCSWREITAMQLMDAVSA